MTTSEPFEGTIGRTYQESEPWWPPLPEDASGARPNVLIILLDDTGFAHLGCYGSTIETPNMDKLAATGLRYTNFHVTPLCSPTRASLLTGRNHHAVGMGKIGNFHDIGFPNKRAAISPHAATLAEILQSEGYATFALGKWHLNPSEENSAAGPYDNWPLQRGFDRYYGFLPGATDQFYPELTYDNHHVDPPALPEDGYHVTEDLVDQAIGFIRDKQSHRSKQPFFMYFALGAMHEPHQAPSEFLAKYRGRFDAGWDAVRQTVYRRQLELGIIPPGTTLVPRNPGVKAWAELSREEQRFMARLQETFAGFLDHTDAQIGRLVDFLEASGELDNTILLLMADNGTSQMGGPTGVVHAGSGSARSATNDGIPQGDADRPGSLPFDDIDDVVRSRLDDIGGPRAWSDVPWGWAQVGNAPLRWYKGDVHGGGVRVPMIARWPDRIRESGIRQQFHHVSDVMPTVLEVLGIDAPAMYQRIDQMPVTGTGFAYTFDNPDAKSRKPVQYFEMDGHRGIWSDGWKAVTRHTRNDPYTDDEWELYHVAQDFSESRDLAASEPDRLRELIDRWWVEAGRNGVFPLDDRTTVLGRPSERPGGPHDGLQYRYEHPISHIPSRVAPAMALGTWELVAHIERSSASIEGVLFALGAAVGGLSLYIEANGLHFEYNARTIITAVHSTVPVPSGRVSVGARLDAERGDGGGVLTLVIDGSDVGSVDVPSLAGAAGRGGADVGLDRLSPVTSSYEAPFRFTGTIHGLEVNVVPFRGSTPTVPPDQESSDR